MDNAREQMSAWVLKAFRVVNAAFPSVDWTRDTPEVQKAEDDLDWALFTYFYSDIAGQPTGTIDGVREAWRAFYRAHLPESQPEMFT
jgi:hypothetical protein